MKSIAVIGLGQFGSQVAISLSQKGFEVLAIDSEEDVVNEYKDLVSSVIILDSTDEKAMRVANVDMVDVAVVAIGSNVQSSLLTVALLQRLGVEDIYVRAIEPLQEGILRSMGIQHIVNIEAEMGKQLSSSLASGKIGRYIQISDRHSLIEVKVPAQFVGGTLKTLDFRSRFNVNIIGIKKQVPQVDDDGEVSYLSQMSDIPDPTEPLEISDYLVVLGTDEYIQKFLKIGNPND